MLGEIIFWYYFFFPLSFILTGIVMGLKKDRIWRSLTPVLLVLLVFSLLITKLYFGMNMADTDTYLFLLIYILLSLVCLGITRIIKISWCRLNQQKKKM
ncbi:hypothetical protein [Thermoactinomyces sp. DSM 45892]|uniref:hypothetical protein n=1 Tax=Thermoactinomyces sp. DSM 45892 TaxID=1882753 RepID=UPI00089A8B7A|nr:hypothetical protein [Thermoactinomyces sp. DSM 45892]SDY86768.1 hypothetical protein SAMN05444416_109118 [Thermoactinomyces sp. DSM 45892]